MSEHAMNDSNAAPLNRRDLLTRLYARRMAEKLVGDDWDEFYKDVKSKDIQDPRLK